MRKSGRAARVALLVVGGAILAAAVYIMVHRIGLNPELDFGAGAYYYADIPDYEHRLDWDTYQAQLPYWVYVVLSPSETATARKSGTIWRSIGNNFLSLVY